MKTVDEIRKEVGEPFNLDAILKKREKRIKNQEKERLVHSLEPLTLEEIEIKQKQLDNAKENKNIHFEFRHCSSKLDVFKRILNLD